MCRVLVVEDELLIALMLEAELQDRGHHVVGVAATVVDGLRLLSDTQPEIAVVDFLLGHENANDLIFELKRSGIPFVLLTGAFVDKQKAQFADVKVLTKPVNFDQLEVVLEQIRTSTIRRPDLIPPASVRCHL